MSWLCYFSFSGYLHLFSLYCQQIYWLQIILNYQELWFAIHLLCMIVRILRLDSGEPIVRSYRIGFISMVHHHLLLGLQMVQIHPAIHQAISKVSAAPLDFNLNSVVLEITSWKRNYFCVSWCFWRCGTNYLRGDSNWSNKPWFATNSQFVLSETSHWRALQDILQGARCQIFTGEPNW